MVSLSLHFSHQDNYFGDLYEDTFSDVDEEENADGDSDCDDMYENFM